MRVFLLHKLDGMMLLLHLEARNPTAVPWSSARGEGFDAPLGDLRWPNPTSVDEGSSRRHGLGSTISREIHYSSRWCGLSHISDSDGGW
jgi:hypothetical protein